MKRYLVAALAVCVLAACGERKEPAGKAGPAEKGAAKAVKAARAPRGAVTITGAQPTGTLTAVPDRVAFAASGPVQEETGGWVDRDASAKCVKVTPAVGGRVYWDSERSFAYVFDADALKPDQQYKVDVDCIPLGAGNTIPVKQNTFTFGTPGYVATNAYITRINPDHVEARVQFAFPMRLFGVEGHFTVATKDGKPAAVMGVAKGATVDTVTVTWKNVKAKGYTLTVGKGMPAADGVHRLSADASFMLAVPDKVLQLSGVQASEAVEGIAVEVACAVSGARTCTVDPDQARRQVQIAPEIPFRVTPSRNGFRVLASFVPDRTYTLKILAGLASREEGVLAADYTTQVKIPRPSPRVQFAVRGHYLGRKGGVKVPLQVRLVDEIKVFVERIPPENVALWGFKEYNWYNYAETVEKEKRVAVGAGQKSSLFWLDLADVLDAGEPGVYRVRATLAEKGKKKKAPHADEESYDEGDGEGGYGYYDAGNRQKTDSVVVVISDLALIAKRSKDHVHAWVVESATGRPAAGAEVKAVSQKNVALGGCTTDGDGYCAFEFAKIRDRHASALFARRDKEWTFLEFDVTTVNMEPFDVAGVPTRDTPYLATIYPERDIYRPGEKVNFAAVVRTRGDYLGASLPVAVKVFTPRGKELAEIPGKTDENGLAAFSFKTDPTSPTGRYALQLTGGEREIASGAVFVETFVPERITAKVQPSKADYGVKEEIPVDVQADYLFGVPAAGEAYRVVCTAQESSFGPKEFPGYTFGARHLRGERPPAVEPETETGDLDDHGHARATCRFKDLSAFTNRVEVSIHGEVSEAGSGRASRAAASASVHPFPYYIGLKPKTTRVEPGKKVEVQGVLVNTDGTLKTSAPRLSWQVYRLHYDYGHVYNPDTRRFEWTSSVQKYPWVDRRRVTSAGGKFTVDFTPEEYWYDYLVEVRDEESSAVGEVQVAGWGWWWESARPESPETMKIELSKQEADYGERIEARVLLPFEGRVLWTVEQDRVITQAWQDAKGETAQWTFEVPRGKSSVYVSALLVRVSEGYLVRRAFGVQRIGIRPSEHRLDLKAEAPEKMRPGETLTVALQGKGRYKATVAIVDEGILQVTRFKSPDIFRAIFADQALEVDTAETLGWVVPKGMEQPGGGEAPGAAQPTFVRLVSHWSGIIESDAQGRAEVKFPVPAYNGKLRVMYSAADKGRLGSGERFVTVSSSVVVSPTVPRYASTGDEFQFPVGLKNTTDAARSARLSVSLDGGALAAAVPASVDVPARGTKVIWVPVAAGKSPGSLVIKVSATSGNEKYDETFTIPLKPDRPFLTEGRFEKVESGVTDLAPHLKDWLSHDLVTRVVLSPVPAVARITHLKYLLHYPYGCIEQTSSTLLPLVRLAPLLPIIDPDRSPSDLQNFVHGGIGRIISMQTPSGGFGYWPGSEDPQPWATVYATFVLLEAQAAGYMVPDSVVQAAVRYLDAHARQTPFGFFVLGRAGKLTARDSVALEQSAAKSGVAEDLLWFAAALHLAGKTALADRVLDQALKAAPQKERRLGRDFYSPLREKALRLYVSELVRPGSQRNEAMMMELVEALRRESYYYSTQELAWGVLALGLRTMNVKYAKRYDAALTVGGKRLAPEKNEFGLSWTVKGFSGGALPLDVNADGAVYVYVENAGYKGSVSSFSAASEGLAIKRRYLTIGGSPAGALKVRDLAVVEVSIDTSQRTALENTAIEVKVPPGVEVENPRLEGALQMPWTHNQKDLWHPEYVEVRDDAVQLFGTVRYGVQKYYVVIRVVTPGTFFNPPVTGSVMYNPEVRGATEAGRVEIKIAE